MAPRGLLVEDPVEKVAPYGHANLLAAVTDMQIREGVRRMLRGGNPKTKASPHNPLNARTINALQDVVMGAGQALSAPITGLMTQAAPVVKPVTDAIGRLPSPLDLDNGLRGRKPATIAQQAGQLADAYKGARGVVAGGAEGLLGYPKQDAGELFDAGAGLLAPMAAKGLARAGNLAEKGLNRAGYTVAQDGAQNNMFVSVTRKSKPPPVVVDGKKVAALTVAKRMQADGKSAEEIWKATGLEYHPVAKQWRHEISDDGAKLKVSYEDLVAAAKAHPTGEVMYDLQDLVDHPELFKQQPHLRDYRVAVSTNEAGGLMQPHAYSMDNYRFGINDLKDPNYITSPPAPKRADGTSYRGTITVGTRPGGYLDEYHDTIPSVRREGDFIRSLLHEMQHATRQASKGFPEGAPVALGKNEYWKNAGETEARLTPVRRDLTPEQRRDFYPGKDPETWLDWGKPQASYSHDFPYSEQQMGPYISQGLYGKRRGWDKARGLQEADDPFDGGLLSVSTARRKGIVPTTKNTQRIAFPGIYKHPNELTDDAAALVAPESPALKGLFGVTRDDLYQMNKGRKGNVDATTIFPAGARGSEAAGNVITDKNARRLVDAMSAAEQRAPQLTNPMDAWYVMDPAFRRLEQLVGKEEAIRRYNDLNAFTSMASPASDVITEMNRGTTANYLNRRGRFGDFEAHSTTPVGKRGGDFPADISGLKPHPYGGTAHSQPMRKYVDGGLLDNGFLNVQTSKVPTYHMASGVPETGFQTNVPVGDAHFARAIGLPDVRNMLTLKGKPVIPQANATMPEVSTLTPWWQQKVVGPLGIESVPGQARAWGLFSPQSGVDTPIGAPKLELLAAEIDRLAQQSGVDPKRLRDAILLGDAGLGNTPSMLPGLLR